MTSDHLTDDDVLSVATGEPSPDPDRSEHLDGCAECKGRVERVRGLLRAAGEELISSRPGCPPVEDLVELPAGAEGDHPHVRVCPLCQEELRVWRAIRNEDLGLDADMIGPLLRGRTGAHAYRGAEEVLRGELVPGAVLEGSLLDAEVRLEVTGGEIVIRVSGTPSGALQLHLSDETVDKTLPLPTGETRLALGSWRWAVIEGGEDASPASLD